MEIKCSDFKINELNGIDDITDLSLYDKQQTEFIIHRSSEDCQALFRFLKDNSFIVSTKQPKNFFSQGYKPRCYDISTSLLPRFFELLEKCRRSHIPLNMTEYQYIPNVSNDCTGLYIDFDIKQTNINVLFNENHYYRIIDIIIQTAIKILDIGPGCITTYAGVVVKSDVVKSGNYYKFGFHLVIPGIKLSKGVKKYLYEYLNNPNQCFLPEYMKKFEKIGMIPFSSDEAGGIDKNSSHVPPLLIGSAKKGKDPYNLEYIFEIQIEKYDSPENKRQTNVFTKISFSNKLLENEKFNAVEEFCLSYTPKHPVILRKIYNIKSE